MKYEIIWVKLTNHNVCTKHILSATYLHVFSYVKPDYPGYIDPVNISDVVYVGQSSGIYWDNKSNGLASKEVCLSKRQDKHRTGYRNESMVLTNKGQKPKRNRYSVIGDHYQMYGQTLLEHIWLGIIMTPSNVPEFAKKAWTKRTEDDIILDCMLAWNTPVLGNLEHNQKVERENPGKIGLIYKEKELGELDRMNNLEEFFT